MQRNQLLAKIPESILSIYEQCEYLAHYLAYNAHKSDSIYQIPEGLKLLGPYSPLDGLVYYILEPTPENASRDIKIIFRGTKDLGSFIRDLEFLAPGSESLKTCMQHILEDIHEPINNLIKRNKSASISLSITGHSLGATDAQNVFAEILRLINQWSDENAVIEEDLHYHKINDIRLIPLNSPGVRNTLATEIITNAQQLKEKNLSLKIKCFWKLTEGDLVQQFGEASVLAGIPHDIAEVHLIKIKPHYAESGFLASHRIKVFNEEAYAKHTYEYFSNKENAELIATKLNNKNRIMQLHVSSWAKYIFYNTAQAFYTFKNWKMHGYPIIPAPVRSHEPWIIVPSIESEQEYKSNDVIPTLPLLMPETLPELTIKIESNNQPKEISAVLSPNSAVSSATSLTSLSPSPQSTLNVEEEKEEYKFFPEYASSMSCSQKFFTPINNAINYKLLQHINDYIFSRTSTSEDELSFTTKLFRNAYLTLEKVKLAKEVRSLLRTRCGIDEIIEAIQNAKIKNQRLEGDHSVVKSDLQRCLLKMEKMLVDPSKKADSNNLRRLSH